VVSGTVLLGVLAKRGVILADLEPQNSQIQRCHYTHYSPSVRSRLWLRFRSLLPGVFNLTFNSVNGTIVPSQQAPSANIDLQNAQQFTAINWDFRSNSPKLRLETTVNRAAFARVRVTALDFSTDESTSSVILNLSDSADNRTILVQIVGDPGLEVDPSRINLSPSREFDF